MLKRWIIWPTLMSTATDNFLEKKTRFLKNKMKQLQGQADTPGNLHTFMEKVCRVASLTLFL